MWGFLVLSPKRCSERASTQTPSWGGEEGAERRNRALGHSPEPRCTVMEGLRHNGGHRELQKAKGGTQTVLGGHTALYSKV